MSAARTRDLRAVEDGPAAGRLDPVAFFHTWQLPPRDQAYLEFHRHRYTLLLSEVAQALQDSDRSSPTILDVSPLMQTELLRASFPSATVNTLGYASPPWAATGNTLDPGERGTGCGPGQEGTTHWQLDLNDCDRLDAWPEVPEHDVLVMAEVLEHLHTAPELVLRRLAQAIRPHGQAILQTPNAAALPKRIALLAGRNPYPRLRPIRWDPGHIREYTRDELLAYAADAGFTVTTVTMQNYFEPDSRKYRSYNRIARLMPPTFRDGLTVRLRKRPVLSPEGTEAPVAPTSLS